MLLGGLTAEKNIISERFAETILNGEGCDFWSEVKRMHTKVLTTSNIVDGLDSVVIIAAH